VSTVEEILFQVEVDDSGTLIGCWDDLAGEGEL